MIAANEKQIARVLGFLSAGPVTLRPAAIDGKVLLDGGERGMIGSSSDCLTRLAQAGLAIRRASILELSEDGRSLLRRQNSENPFQDQHRELVAAEVALPEGKGHVLVNVNESPLAQLARRRGKCGKPFLTTPEFRAGERLRSDYTRGNIMPRLGANWVASVASGRRGGESGIAELTDAALAARQRVEQAIEAVGPELAGVLIDVCCFLKGIETVETERQWPARSAKIVLKTALAALSRHYEPPRKRSGSTLHWGAADYRPAIS